jgi:hypothetical protein
VTGAARNAAVRRPRVRSWPVVLLALPAMVAIWSGWVGLGKLAGFGVMHPLPGTPWDGLTLDTAITLPVGMEAYAAFAIRVWLSGQVPDQARRFAKVSAITSLVVGWAGQGGYHLLAAADAESAPWPVTLLVSSLPVAVLGMGAALVHLIRAGHQRGQAVADPDDPSAGVVRPAGGRESTGSAWVPGGRDRDSGGSGRELSSPGAATAGAGETVERSAVVVSGEGAASRVREAGGSATEVARAYWDAERECGRTPSGAELDRVAGTQDYGRALRRRWLAEEDGSDSGEGRLHVV